MTAARRARDRRLGSLMAAVAVAGGLGMLWLVSGAPDGGSTGDIATEPRRPSPAAAEDLRGNASLLAGVSIAERSARAGYERGCGAEEACVFGPAWTDDHDGEYGHDGCDTRNNVLTRDLDEPAHREGTNGCVVIAGTLNDTYTGETLTFTKDHADAVHIDHVYPLSLAWDMGADDWTMTQRINFANDALNLTAVSAGANTSKGDRGPGEWLPRNDAGVCGYIDRYLAVARRYDLPITPTDYAVVSDVAEQCPQEGHQP